MNIFFNILLIVHIIPSLLILYIYYIIPYIDLKKGSSLKDYVNEIEFDGIPALTIYTLLPIFNWFMIINMFNSNDYYIKDKIRKLLKGIYDFIVEFIIAIWLLIVWMFGLKYVFKIINKIFSKLLTFKIK